MLKSAGISFVLICLFTPWGPNYGIFAITVSSAIFGVCFADWILHGSRMVLENNWRKLVSQTLAFGTFLLPAYAAFTTGLTQAFTPALAIGALAGMYRMFREMTKV